MPIPEKIIIPAAKDPGMGHFYVSLIKSAIRIAAGGFIIYGGWLFSLWPLTVAGILLVLAEGLGILEELV
jgi:hypothetical protein